MWRVGLVMVVFAGAAHAETVRHERPLAIGIALPDAFYLTGHDLTVPLPTLHVGYAVTPAASIEAGVGGIPMGDGGRHILGHIGARYRLTETSLTPFGMARVGAYDNKPDEGTPATYAFALAGGGLEYVHDSGFTLWLELGAGVANVDGATLALAGSLGVGGRL